MDPEGSWIPSEIFYYCKIYNGSYLHVGFCRLFKNSEAPHQVIITYTRSGVEDIPRLLVLIIITIV